MTKVIKTRERLSITSPYFEGVTDMVDRQLERTIIRMIGTQSNEGTVTMKIKIEFVGVGDMEDPNPVPEITCEVTGSIQLKEGDKQIVGKKYGLAVIEPDENGEIKIRGSWQTSLFDEGGK